MLNPFGSLKQKVFPSYLGVDIGTTSVKAVEVKPGKQLPELLNYAMLESTGHLIRANKVLQTSSFKIFESEAVELLKELVKQMKPKSTHAYASLPSFSVFMTVLDLPEMSAGDLEKALVFQAKQYIPLPVSEVALDWIKAGEYNDEKGFKHQQILLISVPQEQIKKYQNIFKMAGLTLQALEVESLALTRALIGADQSPAMLVDFGSRSTNISFVEKASLKYNAQTDFAGSSLTQGLAKALNINPLRAEELKKEKGIIGAGPNYEISTVMLPYLDVIIGEVKKAYFNYQQQFPRSPKVERILLSGGGANLLGVEKYFQEQFNLPTAKAASFYKFDYPSAIDPLVSELNPIFSVALGLTLREFV